MTVNPKIVGCIGIGVCGLIYMASTNYNKIIEDDNYIFEIPSWRRFNYQIR